LLNSEEDSTEIIETIPPTQEDGDVLYVSELVDPIQKVRRRRETARIWITVILGIVFAITTFWALGTATFGTELAWTNTKEALQILLPVESSLLGAAVVFYFTGNGAQS